MEFCLIWKDYMGYRGRGAYTYIVVTLANVILSKPRELTALSW